MLTATDCFSRFALQIVLKGLLLLKSIVTSHNVVRISIHVTIMYISIHISIHVTFVAVHYYELVRTLYRPKSINPSRTARSDSWKLIHQSQYVFILNRIALSYFWTSMGTIMYMPMHNFSKPTYCSNYSCAKINNNLERNQNGSDTDRMLFHQHWDYNLDCVYSQFLCYKCTNHFWLRAKNCFSTTWQKFIWNSLFCCFLKIRFQKQKKDNLYFDKFSFYDRIGGVFKIQIWKIVQNILILYMQKIAFRLRDKSLFEMVFFVIFVFKNKKDNLYFEKFSFYDRKRDFSKSKGKLYRFLHVYERY